MERKFYNVRFAAQPINWSNNDLASLEENVSFQQILDEIHEVGYEGTELGKKYPKDTKILKKELKKRNLVLTSGFGKVHFTNPELSEEFFKQYKEHVLFLKEMGCEYVITCEIGNSSYWHSNSDMNEIESNNLNEEQWCLLSQGLNKAGQFCKENGMKLVYHMHADTPINSLEQIRKLMNLTDKDKVFLVGDTGHLFYCGVDLESFFEEFVDRIKYIHLKDVREEVLLEIKKYNIDFEAAVRLGVFTVPGDGSVDFTPIMDILEENNYQGWIVVEAEQNPKYANPLIYASKAREYIRIITNM